MAKRLFSSDNASSLSRHEDQSKLLSSRDKSSIEDSRTWINRLWGFVNHFRLASSCFVIASSMIAALLCCLTQNLHPALSGLELYFLNSGLTPHPSAPPRTEIRLPRWGKQSGTEAGAPHETKTPHGVRRSQGEIGSLEQRRHQRLLGVEAVFRFVPDHGAGTVEDFGGDFLAAVGG